MIMPASAAAVIMHIAFTHKLSRACGCGTAFTFGPVLLEPIFILVLAFGGSEYHGADL